MNLTDKQKELLLSKKVEIFCKVEEKFFELKNDYDFSNKPRFGIYKFFLLLLDICKKEKIELIPSGLKKDGFNALHEHYPIENKHYIHCDSDLSIKEATYYLWHELCHYFLGHNDLEVHKKVSNEISIIDDKGYGSTKRASITDKNELMSYSDDELILEYEAHMLAQMILIDKNKLSKLLDEKKSLVEISEVFDVTDIEGIGLKDNVLEERLMLLNLEAIDFETEEDLSFLNSYFD